MKTNVLALSFLFYLGLTSLFAGQPNPRFDGKWAGTEIYIVSHSRSQWGHEPIQVPTMFMIADTGKLLGFLQGISLGRYEVSKSNDNKLSFKSTVRVGRMNGTLTLSPDGNTLTETAFGILPGTPFAVTCDIAGTFHRQGSK